MDDTKFYRMFGIGILAIWLTTLISGYFFNSDAQKGLIIFFATLLSIAWATLCPTIAIFLALKKGITEVLNESKTSKIEEKQ